MMIAVHELGAKMEDGDSIDRVASTFHLRNVGALYNKITVSTMNIQNAPVVGLRKNFWCPLFPFATRFVPTPLPIS
jgi:hypothetical protein